MTLRRVMIALLAAAVIAVPLAGTVSAQAKEMFVPSLVYRTGPYAPSGIPFANGMWDYLTMLNERDGGVNGVRLVVEECETQYDTKQGVECYERLKGKSGGAMVFNPLSTGITYQLIPKAAVDKIVVHSMGYGMTAAADGRWFPWVFNFPTTYWSQASSVIRYMGAAGGRARQAEGQEDRPHLPQQPLRQGSQPDARGAGPEVRLRADAARGGPSRPGAEGDVAPGAAHQPGLGVPVRLGRDEPGGGEGGGRHQLPDGPPHRQLVVGQRGGRGARRVTGPRATRARPSTPPAANFKVHADIVKHVYDKGKNIGPKDKIGEALYNRGVINAMYTTEAIRTAMAKYGNKPLTAEQVRWGYEHFNITDARLDQIGLKGFTHAVKVTCEDHEGNGPVLIQQWDGKKWNIVSEWVQPMRDVVRPKLEAAAVEEGKKLGYTARDCSKEN